MYMIDVHLTGRSHPEEGMGNPAFIGIHAAKPGARRRTPRYLTTPPRFDLSQLHDGTPAQKKFIRQWGNRRGRPWMTGEIVEARCMRQLGASSEAIAKHLDRSTRSVDAKLGHKGPRSSNSVRAST